MIAKLKSMFHANSVTIVFFGALFVIFFIASIATGSMLMAGLAGVAVGNVLGNVVGSEIRARYAAKAKLNS